jgi:hypothetical protein
MAQKLITDTHLYNIADAIRLKNQTSSLYTPSTMAAAIEAIPAAVPYNWMGSNVECLSSSFYHSVVYAPSTTYANWTASTTAKALVASKNMTSFIASDMEHYAYLIRWIVETNISYLSTATLEAFPIRAINLLDQQIIRRPSSLTNIHASAFNSAITVNPLGIGWTQYYNTSGSLTYTWAAAYGFYGTLVAPAITNSTSANITVTPRVPSLYTRCSSTIFATARKPEVDIENTYYTIHAELYRMDFECCELQRYASLVDLINA